MLVGILGGLVVEGIDSDSEMYEFTMKVQVEVISR